jgi:acyl-CoA synthetase (AMP-forming)/AMP-acid ligase II
MSSSSRTIRTLPGASSKPFKALPLDAQPTIPEIFAHHAESCASHNFFVYANGEDIKSITYAQAYRAQLKVAHAVQAVYESNAHLHSSREDQAVIGILANLGTRPRAFASPLPKIDSRQHHVLYNDDGHHACKGEMRCSAPLCWHLLQTGAASFPISTRNSPLAVAHLLRSTNTRQIFVSEDTTMQSLFNETAKLLAQDGFAVQALDVPQFEDLYNDEAAPASEDVQLWPFDFASLAIILHSSGTSSFPKPIRIPHRQFLSFGAVTCACAGPRSSPFCDQFF